MPETIASELRFLQDLWDEREAERLKPLELLRYRSNLLGADLRITNFGGGNTSSKFELPDPLTGMPERVLAVKGSGGDLRSIGTTGFALLYLDKLEALINRYRSEAEERSGAGQRGPASEATTIVSGVQGSPRVTDEDEMVALYPFCAFGENRVAASIDTPLHAFLPFNHVDHLHPDWAIALAASANGETKLEEFNARYGRRIIWVPWQRPGFELALMLRRAVDANPGCDGLVLGGHGLFTWGDTQRDCYVNSVRTIDQMGEFVEEHTLRPLQRGPHARQPRMGPERGSRAGAPTVRTLHGGVAVGDPGSSGRPMFGGAALTATIDREATAAAVLPYLRGVVSSNRRVVAHWNSSDDALMFASSKWGEDLCRLGTSCPDHFLRTRICPLFVPWNPADGLDALRKAIAAGAVKYREDYFSYYRAFAQKDSPALRDSNPSVVVIPGVGLFGFARDKREARITTEFFVNAIHVMAGATALEERSGAGQAGSPTRQPRWGAQRGPASEATIGSGVQGSPRVKEEDSGRQGTLPQARFPEQARQFTSFHNYVALPRLEAFRIEYWALEEAKLQRLPAEREFSRKIVLVVGGGSGIGREVVLQIAKRGGHVIAGDVNLASAEAVAKEAAAVSSTEMVMACDFNLASRESMNGALRAITLQFGGLDVCINTAAIYPTPDASTSPETVWGQAMAINVSSNHVLAQEAAEIFRAQNLPATIVLTSSANAVVPKQGSEPYDVSKAAINHLIRELAIGLGPHVRVNGIAPATVIAGSSMFPRDRVIGSLKKYQIVFSDEESTESLRDKLADFYAKRTITRRPILPADCANAICWLAGDQSAKTTGHVIPVDGGLPEAFLR